MTGEMLVRGTPEEISATLRRVDGVAKQGVRQPDGQWVVLIETHYPTAPVRLRTSPRRRVWPWLLAGGLITLAWLGFLLYLLLMAVVDLFQAALPYVLGLLVLGGVIALGKTIFGDGPHCPGPWHK